MADDELATKIGRNLLGMIAECIENDCCGDVDMLVSAKSGQKMSVMIHICKPCDAEPEEALVPERPHVH